MPATQPAAAVCCYPADQQLAITKLRLQPPACVRASQRRMASAHTQHATEWMLRTTTLPLIPAHPSLTVLDHSVLCPVSSAAGSYTVFFKRSSSFLVTIFASAFVLDVAFDGFSNKLWDYANQGRQWKDIRHKYIKTAEE
eukprot:jgi/Hompol1/6781/HPOL_005100-RA